LLIAQVPSKLERSLRSEETSNHDDQESAEVLTATQPPASGRRLPLPILFAWVFDVPGLTCLERCFYRIAFDRLFDSREEEDEEEEEEEEL
jgi:hypothetical protein